MYCNVYHHLDEINYLMVCVDNSPYHLHNNIMCTELINNDGIVRPLFTWSHNNYYVVIMYNYSVFRHNFGLDFQNCFLFHRTTAIVSELSCDLDCCMHGSL